MINEAKAKASTFSIRTNNAHTKNCKIACFANAEKMF